MTARSDKSGSPLVAVVGPTGIGKTALAVAVSGKLGAEIVSADSRQVYIGLDIGTAKPSRAERKQVRHHLIDILTPDQTVTVAGYQARAYAVIKEVMAGGWLPMLVGGTGQYIRAVLEGWSIPEVPPHPQIREELELFSQEHGAAALHARLAEIDPTAADTIDARNVRRVIRALEVNLVTGTMFSALRQRRAPNWHVLCIGLTRPRPELYALIDARIDKMIACGLVAEVEGLLRVGYDWRLPAMSGLGYAEICTHLRGECSLDDAIALIKRNTRRFIRKQYSWFSLADSTIAWFDLARTSHSEIYTFISDWIGKVVQLKADSSR